MVGVRVAWPVFVSLTALAPLAGLAVADPGGHPPAVAAALDRVCLHTAVGVWDFSMAASSPMENDVVLADNGMGLGSPLVYYGLDSRFEALEYDIGMAGSADGEVLWWYWSGATWTPLKVRDDTDNFHNAGTNTVSFHAPGDWQVRSLPDTGCPGSYFYVKTTTEWNYAELPFANRIVAQQ